MAQRSPHNARYQKHTKPEGKTRRSAASVKPKRDLGAGATQSSTSSSKKVGSGSSRSGYRVPMTPEYRKWRNVWWGMLGGSALCAAIYLLADYLARQGALSLPAPARVGLLVGCYAFLGIGWYVDWRKVRPARAAALAGGGQAPKPPTKRADQPTGESAK